MYEFTGNVSRYLFMYNQLLKIRPVIYIVFLSVFCLMVQYATGQIPGTPKSLPSPNASSLGLYGEYPVSYFTGVPKIEIPLYNLISGEVNVPISLNYHASGFRPDMHPGWVGSGWNLEAGGAISRVVKDLPDDYSNIAFDKLEHGYYFNHDILNTPTWRTGTHIRAIARTAEAIKDTEPDEFSFNVNGLSGQFYLGHDGKWKVRCDRPVKITFNNSFIPVPFSRPWFTVIGNFKSFSGFTITDEYGVQYHFGGSAGSIEYSVSLFEQYAAEWIANTWLLTKIVYPLGDEATFEYERDDFVIQMGIFVNSSLNYYRYVDGSLLPISCGSYYFPSLNDSYDGQLVSPIYLSKITSKNETIRFLRTNSTELRYGQHLFTNRYSKWQAGSPHSTFSFFPFLEDDYSLNTYPAVLNKLQWKKLDEIRIEVDASIEKRFLLNYSSNPTQRLTLNSVVEMEKTGTTLKPYTFSYNTSVQLPGYLANMTDHWGFFNGTSASLSNLSAYYNLRQPNATYLQAGTLKQIKYPTGGLTDFTFEPHSYRCELSELRWAPVVNLSSNTLAGGLRIRKISSYDPEFPADKVENEFFYVKNYSSTGTPSSLPSSGALGGKSRYMIDDYRVNAFNDNDVYRRSVFSSRSVLPASSNAHGSHIGYTEVVEKRNDGSYTKFKFSNFDNPLFQDESPISWLPQTLIEYTPYRSRSANRGKLLEEAIHTSSDILLQKRTLQYTQINTDNEQARALYAVNYLVCSSINVPVSEGLAYVNYTYSFLPTTEIINIYDENGANPVTTTKNYTYDTNYRLLKQMSVTDSRHQTLNTRYKYVFDVLTNYNPTNINAQYFPYAYLISSNNIATPAQVLHSVIEGDTEKVTGATVQTFKGVRLYYYPAVHWRAVPDKFYNLKIVAPFSAPIEHVNYTSVNSTSTSENINVSTGVAMVNQYEYAPMRSYNKTKLVGVSNAGNHVVSTIYGQYMKHPIAQITGGRFLESAYCSFETNASDSDWRGGGGQVLTRFSNQGAPVGNFCTNNTGTSGYITTYDKQLIATNSYVLTFWEKGGTVTLRNSGAISISNIVLQTKGAWTQREIRFRNVMGNLEIIPAGYIDDLRLHPVGAQMDSQTYNQLGSVTSSTDTRGYTTYYEYDNFNRLISIKDRQGRILKNYSYNLK